MEEYTFLEHQVQTKAFPTGEVRKKMIKETCRLLQEAGFGGEDLLTDIAALIIHKMTLHLSHSFLSNLATVTSSLTSGLSALQQRLSDEQSKSTALKSR